MCCRRCRTRIRPAASETSAERTDSSRQTRKLSPTPTPTTRVRRRCRQTGSPFLLFLRSPRSDAFFLSRGGGPFLWLAGPPFCYTSEENKQRIVGIGGAAFSIRLGIRFQTPRTLFTTVRKTRIPTTAMARLTPPIRRIGCVRASALRVLVPVPQCQRDKQHHHQGTQPADHRQRKRQPANRPLGFLPFHRILLRERPRLHRPGRPSQSPWSAPSTHRGRCQ